MLSLFVATNCTLASAMLCENKMMIVMIVQVRCRPLWPSFDHKPQHT